MSRPLPTGTVTFLLTDVEGSSRLWEEFPDRAGAALDRHDAIIESAVGLCEGVVIRPRGEGDSRFCVFDKPSNALAAALAIQQGLHKEPWDVPRPVRVRIGIHSGETELRAGDYYGTTVNRCARLRGIGHGGQTLISTVTRGMAGADLPAGTSLRDLGEYHLRDLAEPERVFQLCHPDLPGDYGPLRSVDTVRNNLPVELTSFVGRETQVSAVKKRVSEDRLVTVHGVGGCGKTRLAVQVADELIGTFADGEWFVELAPITDPELIPDAIASAIGLREARSGIGTESEPALVGNLLEHLLAYLSERNLLLVLDNCEHLIDGAAAFCEQILQACPSVHILATSREALGLDAEIAWRIPSLSTPPVRAQVSVEELSAYEACRLFVERARQRRSDFELVERDVEAIVEICARLDGIPLAIELAAARVRMLTPTQIAERLGDFFRLLVGGSRTRMERQQTLRAAIDWSYEPLDDRERTLFRRLSAFAGTFAIEAIESICAGDGLEPGEVLDLVASLVDKSMLEVESVRGQTRYHMLETFRQYAREKLAEARESDAVRERHLTWYAEFAARAEPELHGPRQGEWLRRLDADYDNLRVALEFAEAAGEAERGLEMAANLGNFWAMRGHHAEGRTWLDSMLAAAPGADPTIRAWALHGAGTLALDLGDVGAVIDLGARLREVAARSGDARLSARAKLREASNLAFLSNDPRRGKASLEEAVALARESDDLSLLSGCLQTLGLLLSQEGDLQGARATLEEALGHARRAGDIGRIAQVSITLSLVLLEGGLFAEAERHAINAIQIQRELGDKTMEASALQVLAIQSLRVCDLVAAREHLREASDLMQDIGASGTSLRTLEAYVSMHEGDLEAARSCFQRLAAEAAAHDLRAAGAEAALGLARVARAAGDPAEALAFARRSIDLWPMRGIAGRVPLCLETVAGCLRELGDPEGSARLLGACRAMRVQTGQPPYPVALPLLETDIAAARDALGEVGFEAAWAAGRDLSLDEAIALALGASTV